MDLESFNDNGRRFIEVACSICGGVTEPHAGGVEPVCIFCFYEPGPCACGGRPESICGTCGVAFCGSDNCLNVHEHLAPGRPAS
jgi:hypothetical protein